MNLQPCSENKLQQITFLKDGTIRPKHAQDMCFTAGLGTKIGRGGTSLYTK